MKTRTTTAQLDTLARLIARALGVPEEPYTNTAAPGGPPRYVANPGAVYRSGAYGGHEFQQMTNPGEGARSLIWEGHIPAREAADRARAFLAGIYAGRQPQRITAAEVFSSEDTRSTEAAR